MIVGDLMKLYSYVVAVDTGFAPDPFDNFCSLACCKPIIRKSANIDDWIVGTGSKSSVGNDKLVYAMKITEKIDFNDYYHNSKFNGRADNIYYKNNDIWIQKKNPFHGKNDMKHDLNGLYVLISNDFYYFGKKAITIPSEFKELIKRGPGHKSNFQDEFIDKFIKWLEKEQSNGMYANPYDFHEDKCKYKL